MGTTPDHLPSTDDDTTRVHPEEDTLADREQWAVPEQYRVEATEQPDDDATVVVQQGPAAVPSGRRFPPDIAPGLLLVLLAAILLVPAAFLASSWLGDDDSPGTTATTDTLGTTTNPAPTTPATPARRAVPEVVGARLSEARSQLEDAGFTVRTRAEPSDSPRNEVLEQSPEAGARAARNAVVLLTVSSGPERVTVPAVVGLSQDEATDALRSAGLRPEIRTTRSEEPEGTVLRQRPAAESEVAPDSVVRLDVAEAPPQPATIEVPRLVGLPVADARARLRELGLRSSVTRAASAKPAGTVVAQSPGPGTDLTKGQSVQLSVSSGPALVRVVDVTGLDELSARQELEAAGFEVEVVDEPTSDASEDGLVVRQDPAGGQRAPRGSVVTLTVARLG